MEYSSLLDRANNEEDPCVRLALAVTFTIAQYGNIEGRNLKPFNPVLGETYELCLPQFKFMSEQVSHHPPITAYCCHNENFETYGNTEVSGSF